MPDKHPHSADVDPAVLDRARLDLCRRRFLTGGLSGARLVTGDKSLGMLGALEGRRRSLETLHRPRILLLRALGSWPLKLLALVAAILALFIALKAAGV